VGDCKEVGHRQAGHRKVGYRKVESSTGKDKSTKATSLCRVSFQPLRRGRGVREWAEEVCGRL